jgi:hypothetical protein
LRSIKPKQFMDKIRVIISFLSRITAVALILYVELVSCSNAKAQCSVAIVNMSVSAGASKCGFQEFVQSSPPLNKYYLVETYAASASVSYYLCTAGSPGTVKYTYKENDTYTEDPNECTNSANYSGSANFTWNLNLIGEGAGSESGNLDSTTGEWDAGGGAATSDGYEFILSLEEDDYIGAFTGTSSTTPTTQASTTTGSYSWMPGGGDGENFTVSDNAFTILSDEYTDQILRQVMIGKLPPYPPDLVTNWPSGSGTAFYSLAGDHASCSGGKMKYKFYLCPQYSAGQSYKITWKQITTYPGTNTPPSIAGMSETITASGSPDGTYGAEHDVDVPQVPSSIYEADPIVTSIKGGGGGN